MINETERNDNQSAQADNQGAQGMNPNGGTIRAEDSDKGAAMTETPQAGAAGEPEGKKPARRVNIPATGKHSARGIRGRREAYSAKYQAAKAAKAAAAFPDLNDDIARAYVSNMLAQFDKAPADAEAFERNFNGSAGLKLADEMERRIDETVKASGETGRRADHLRFILRFYATLAPFMARDRIRAKLAGEGGKPAPKRRSTGRKKAAPALLTLYYTYPYRPEFADIPQMISKDGTPARFGIKVDKDAERIPVKVWSAPTGTRLALRSEINVNLSVGVDQLFKWNCIQLAENNHTGKTTRKDREINRTVKTTLGKWIELKGGDTEIHADRPRDSEIQRIKNLRANSRRELKNYAKFLSNAILYKTTKEGKVIVDTWEEAGSSWGFLNIFASGYYDLPTDTLVMTFESDTAEEIIDSPSMRKISAALFRLNGNNINAYRIECAALNLYTMDNNYGKPQANTLTAGQMLEYTDIQPPQTFIERGQDWQKSKKALENSLNAAVSAGVITRWRYCGTNGAELTPAEIKKLTGNPTDWEGANIWQDFPPLSDQTPRIERKEKKRAEKQKRKEKSELEAMKKDVSGLKKTVYHRKKKQDGNQ